MKWDTPQNPEKVWLGHVHSCNIVQIGVADRQRGWASRQTNATPYTTSFSLLLPPPPLLNQHNQYHPKTPHTHPPNTTAFSVCTLMASKKEQIHDVRNWYINIHTSTKMYIFLKLCTYLCVNSLKKTSGNEKSPPLPESEGPTRRARKAALLLQPLC